MVAEEPKYCELFLGHKMDTGEVGTHTTATKLVTLLNLFYVLLNKVVNYQTTLAPMTHSSVGYFWTEGD